MARNRPDLSHRTRDGGNEWQPALRRAQGSDCGGHWLARLVHLGIRQSRYFGRTKTRFQLYLAATVANLTLVTSRAGLPEDTGGASKVGSALRTRIIHSTVDFIPARLCQIWALALLTSASLPKFIFPNRAFRPDF